MKSKSQYSAESLLTPNFSFDVCLNFGSCQVLTYNWHFGQLINYFSLQAQFLESRVYYSDNFIKTCKTG